MFDPLRGRFARPTAVLAGAVLAGIVCMASPLTANAQFLPPDRLTNVALLLITDAKKPCLSTADKLRDLNEGAKILSEIQAPGSGVTPKAKAWWLSDIRDKLYQIRAKEPCEFTVIYYTGGFVKKDIGGSHLQERYADDGSLSNFYDLVKDPLGGGIDAGFYVSPWKNAFRMGGFASFDMLNLAINKTFPGGSYLGTTSRWYATAGVKAGFVTPLGPFIYALGGAGLHNMDMNINLGGPVTSQNTTVPGGILGLGAEFKPAMLQTFKLPVSVYLQYQHGWWQAAHLNQPAASPLFNYTFRREDDSFQLGFHVELNPTPESYGAPLITKAVPLK